MKILTATNGSRLAYEAFGSRDDAPLLLIQGFGAQMLGWPHDFCAKLSEEGLYVVRFDNRDVGASQRFPGTDYNISSMADDAAGLIDALGFDAMHIVGQSMGGMIAQRLAVEHPEKVLSLCLYYTTPASEYLVGKEALAERENLPIPSTREEAMDLYVLNEAPCGSPAYPTDVNWLRELGGLMWDRGFDKEGIDRQRHAIASQPDLRDGLDNVAVPTLILHGDADQLIAPGASRRLAEIISGSKLHIYPGMGHQLPPPLWSDMITRIADNIGSACTKVQRNSAL